MQWRVLQVSTVGYRAHLVRRADGEGVGDLNAARRDDLKPRSLYAAHHRSGTTKPGCIRCWLTSARCNSNKPGLQLKGGKSVHDLGYGIFKPEARSIQITRSARTIRRAAKGGAGPVVNQRIKLAASNDDAATPVSVI